MRDEDKVTKLTDDINRLEYCIDINECKREALYNNEYSIPLFTVMNIPRQFTGGTLIENAKYYVETNQYMPFHRNGLYYYQLFGLVMGIILHNHC